MAGKQSINLGPFTGGLNTLDDPASVADTELVDVVNLEFETDGSLTSRFPITKLSAPVGLGASTYLKIIGYYLDATTSPANRYLIGSTDVGTYSSLDGINWTSITTSFGATDCVQFAGFLWLIASASSASSVYSGKWNPTTAFATVSNMAKGDSIVVYKSRMFVVPGKVAPSNGSRLQFSSISGTDGSITWTATDFIDVNPGSDGQNLVDLIVQGDNIFLFKSDSTYVYSYSGAPSNGRVSLVNAYIGVSDTHCVVQSEDGVYLMHRGDLFLLVNTSFDKINERCPFNFTSSGTYTNYTTVSSLSYFDSRLIVRVYDRTYVYYTQTRTWSRWETAFFPAWWNLLPRVGFTTDPAIAYAVSLIQGDLSVYRLKNAFDSGTTEQMTCSIRTKTYDYKSASTFKRLFWWGIDCISKSTVTVYAWPVVYRDPTIMTYDQMNGFSKYDNVGYSYDYPIYLSPQVQDTANPGTYPSRKFIKFLKSLRFRSIYFTVSIPTDGTVSSATQGIFYVERVPVKIFNLTTVIADKELVSAKVT